MRKALFLSLALILATAASSFAQLRDYVALLKPAYEERVLGFLKELAGSMRSDGYEDEAKLIEAYAEGGYGSGFVYVDKAGDNYLVTNRHVVADASSVTVEFEKADGTKTSYPGCALVAIDDKLDLALVALPKGTRPFKRGLFISAGAIDDGAEVWSAGFPGLGGKPLWQFGKGNVTNASARVVELADPAVTSLLQHSAQIDPGNSGGPLLVADPKAAGGYRVVGINTWKAVDRQATNFAIPAAAIIAFLDRSVGPARAAPDAAKLKAKAAEMADFLGAAEVDYRSFARFVSYEYVAAEGRKALDKVLDSAPTEDREYIVGTFIGFSPIEGMRLAVAWSIVNHLASMREGEKDFALSSGEVEGEVTGNTGTVGLGLGAESVKTGWIVEGGSWKLASLPFPEKKAASGARDSGFTIEAPYFLKLGGGAVVSTSSRVEGHLELAITDLVDAGLGFSGFNVVQNDSWTGVPVTYGLFETEVRINVQLPLSFHDYFVVPYAGIRPFAAIDLDFGYVSDKIMGLAWALGAYGGLESFRSLSVGLEIRVNPAGYGLAAAEVELLCIYGL